MVRSTSRKSSWLRSFISFSVNTVTDCGMSLISCLPLPTVVCLISRVSLPCGAACSFTVTAGSVASGVVPVCAQLPTEAASIMAPRGSKTLSDWGAEEGVDCSMLLPRGAQVFAKVASENGWCRWCGIARQRAPAVAAQHGRGMYQEQTRGNG